MVSGAHVECLRFACGLVWFGLVWFGLVWFGLVWFGLVWFGCSLDGTVSVHDFRHVVLNEAKLPIDELGIQTMCERFGKDGGNTRIVYASFLAYAMDKLWREQPQPFGRREASSSRVSVIDGNGYDGLKVAASEQHGRASSSVVSAGIGQVRFDPLLSPAWGDGGGEGIISTTLSSSGVEDTAGLLGVARMVQHARPDGLKGGFPKVCFFRRVSPPHPATALYISYVSLCITPDGCDAPTDDVCSLTHSALFVTLTIEPTRIRSRYLPL